MIRAVGVAFASGALVVLSPCTLPVMPGLLAVVGRAHSTGDASPWARTRPIVVFALSVAVGLAGVVALGSALARGLPVMQPPWSVIPAFLLLLAGLFTVGLGPPGPQQYLVHRAANAGDSFVPVFSGLALGAAWTPCATPSLGLGLLAASQAKSFFSGLAVLTGYVLGVVFPVAAISVGALNLPALRRGVQRAGRGLQLGSGCILVACAVLVATGVWSRLISWLTTVA